MTQQKMEERKEIFKNDYEKDEKREDLTGKSTYRKERIIKYGVRKKGNTKKRKKKK